MHKEKIDVYEVQGLLLNVCRISVITMINVSHYLGRSLFLQDYRDKLLINLLPGSVH